MKTRRQFLKAGALAGAGLLLPGRWARRVLAAIPGGTLLPGDITRYAMPLVIPPAMPTTNKGIGPKGVDKYKIAVRQFQQLILPPGLPMTTVWSYGAVDSPATFNYPAFTIEAAWQKTAQVEWVNELIDPATGNYLPHILPVDPTLHWANPPGGHSRRDSMPMFRSTPGPYTGPVPMVTHVHGAHTTEESDGYPEAWYLPAANNIPGGYATTGTFYDSFVKKYKLGWDPGTAVFRYPNYQRATTLWYHDHTLGMTRLNVYAGPAGFYLLRGGSQDLPPGTLPGPAPGVGANPFGTYYEIPIVIQDRSFNGDGSLFYPHGREFFDEFAGPFIPDTTVPPIWNPEFFGNVMVVNGRSWPHLDVEQRRYRFRLLNGCNSRFLILKLSDSRVELWQIGAEGGFLRQPVNIDNLPGTRAGTLLMAPAERADVIADFTNVPLNTEIILLNLGPDEPFKGFNADGTLSDGSGSGAIDPADPASTGVVMRLRVVAATGSDTSTPPDQLTLPSFADLVPGGHTRQLSLHEEVYEPADIPVAARLGTDGEPKHWGDPVTENPVLNSTEEWHIDNQTEDAHPIHIHLVQFQVVGRDSRPPEPWEDGFKDTVIAYPGEITKLKARFDRAGLYVWHCHIVEHEDNEMMRPYRVGP